MCLVQWYGVSNHSSDNDGSIFTDVDHLTIDNCYILFGGIIAPITLCISCIIAPGYIGYTGAYICSICGNLIMSTVFDAFGVFGVNESLTSMRMVGLSLVLVAVVAVNLPQIFKFGKSNQFNTNKSEIIVHDHDESLITLLDKNGKYTSSTK